MNEPMDTVWRQIVASWLAEVALDRARYNIEWMHADFIYRLMGGGFAEIPDEELARRLWGREIPTGFEDYCRVVYREFMQLLDGAGITSLTLDSNKAFALLHLCNNLELYDRISTGRDE
jgi:hypothetical protein